MRTSWHLDKNHARLEQEPLSARLDLFRPDAGLHRMAGRLAAFAEAELLGVDFPSSAAADPDLVVENYARGSDLIVAYRQTESWPVRVDVLWQALTPCDSDRFTAGIELLVSVRTEVLESCPRLTARTAIAADEVLRLADAGGSRFEPVIAQPSTELGLGQGPGCLLFRRSGAELSYVEMIHPADFQRDALSVGTETAGPILLRHRLFRQALEKGVILRARLRGIFCAADVDTSVAAEAYRAFAATEPPLGT